MDLDHDFFQVSKLSEDQFLGERIKRRPKKKNFSPNSGEDHKKKQKKKKVFTKNGTFFSRIQVETCTRMHTGIKLLERLRMKTILKLWGVIRPNYWGDISPPGFGPPAHGYED